VSTAARQAAEDGCRVLYFWAGSDNATAVGFASSFGFRPTAQRRPVRVAEGAAEKDADEVAMMLSLSAHRLDRRTPCRQRSKMRPIRRCGLVFKRRRHPYLK